MLLVETEVKCLLSLYFRAMIERIQNEFALWWENILAISTSIIFGTILLVSFIILGKFARNVFVTRFG
jgi:hypothetical protein